MKARKRYERKGMTPASAVAAGAPVYLLGLKVGDLIELQPRKDIAIVISICDSGYLEVEAYGRQGTWTPWGFITLLLTRGSLIETYYQHAVVITRIRDVS